MLFNEKKEKLLLTWSEILQNGMESEAALTYASLVKQQFTSICCLQSTSDSMHAFAA